MEDTCNGSEQEDILGELQEITRRFVRGETADKGDSGGGTIATVLFLDLKGFTSLSEKMDSEEIRRVISGIFKVFTRVVEKHTGTVDRYEGDAMLALFGVEDSPADRGAPAAVACGLELQTRLVQANQMFGDASAALFMRVGIATGDVVTGSGGDDTGRRALAGGAIDAATVLEGNCPLGGVLVADPTCKLCGNKFLFNDAGTLLAGDSKGGTIQVWLADDATSS